MVSQGVGAFWHHEVALEVEYAPDALGIRSVRRVRPRSRGANHMNVVRSALFAYFPEVVQRRERRSLTRLVSIGAGYELQDRLGRTPALLGAREQVWVPLSDEAQLSLDGRVDRALPENDRVLSDAQLGWLDTLVERGLVRRAFNTRFLTGGDSREPELAGIGGAVRGTVLTLFVTLLLSFPIGVAAAVYLEEFAPRNRFTDFIEVNINNLAAVPSVVFGLLGFAVFLNVLGLPRSGPLVGGMVLALMTLPAVVIASRASLASVPPSIREAALGVGASPLQAVVHHVLPQAMPGILSGTILGMARALGETAPLLMIGMVAFIADVPSGLGDPATTLPVQIYNWADSPERAFVTKTSGAVLILLAVLIALNLLALLLRTRLERRW